MRFGHGGLALSVCALTQNVSKNTLCLPCLKEWNVLKRSDKMEAERSVKSTWEHFFAVGNWTLLYFTAFRWLIFNTVSSSPMIHCVYIWHFISWQDFQTQRCCWFKFLCKYKSNSMDLDHLVSSSQAQIINQLANQCFSSSSSAAEIHGTYGSH